MAPAPAYAASPNATAPGTRNPARTAYTAADAPVFGEVGHGPWCLGLPDDYEKPAPFIPLDDGSDKDNPDGGLG